MISSKIIERNTRHVSRTEQPESTSPQAAFSSDVISRFVAPKLVQSTRTPARQKWEWGRRARYPPLFFFFARSKKDPGAESTSLGSQKQVQHVDPTKTSVVISRFHYERLLRHSLHFLPFSPAARPWPFPTPCRPTFAVEARGAQKMKSRYHDDSAAPLSSTACYCCTHLLGQQHNTSQKLPLLVNATAKGYFNSYRTGCVWRWKFRRSERSSRREQRKASLFQVRHYGMFSLTYLVNL